MQTIICGPYKLFVDPYNRTLIRDSSLINGHFYDFQYKTFPYKRTIQ